MNTTTHPALTLWISAYGGWSWDKTQGSMVRVTFEGPEADARGAAYIATHGYLVIEGEEDDNEWGAFPLTMDALFPTCEHGMSAALCAGPDHYPQRPRHVTDPGGANRPRPQARARARGEGTMNTATPVRSQDYCPRCDRLVALHADGTFYPHGPLAHRCAGSGQEAPEAPRSEAEIMARVTGSRGATVVHERRELDGSLTEISRETWTRRRTCTACGEAVEHVEGVGWVEVQEGGHYDQCPERYEEETDTPRGHVV